ncbi:ATP-dependent nuclease [Methanosarcina sp. UBA411]|uniref:ATP-dependent nuclease n=1 Tax=Methanosarcina sp. UBA411 TaxID=1915589 RepID=UPI0025D7A985|nr:AAA family ATPase [Methanosarcina sp. UBA411]
MVIRNFRSIKYIDIKFQNGMNLIVGKNNAGKSNILNALNMLFGDKFPTYLTFEDKDFHKYKNNLNEIDDGYFWILAELSGSISSHINEIKGINMGKLLCFPFLEGETQFDIHDALKIDIDKELEKSTYFDIWANNSKRIYVRPDGKHNADLNKYLKELKNAWILLYVKKDDKGEICQPDFSLILQTHTNSYRCWGLSTEFRDSLINSAVIPSFRDPEKQLKINNWTWYGKLIKKTYDENKDKAILNADSDKDPKTYSETMNTLFKRINETGNMLFDDIIQDIKQNMDLSFQGCDFSLQFVMDTKDDIYKAINIFVDDGYKSLLSNKGSGIQSAFIISLFCYYCSKFHKNSSLLVVEEPELYLHPQGRRSILQVFEDFVSLQNIENQVIITTHSSDFIKPDYVNRITVVRKEEGETKKYKVDIPDADDFKKKQIFNWKQNNELFFSEKILIVEGAEERIIPLLADKITNIKAYLDKNNISVIRANGKGNIAKYIQIAENLNIEWFALADLDFLFHGLENLKNIVEYDEAKLSEIRSKISKLTEHEDDKWKNNKKLEPRLLKPKESLDAKAFCKIMEKWEYGEKVEEELLNLWKHIKPNLESKASETLLDNHPDVYKLIKEFIINLKKNDIYILQKGELEDYLTEEGVKLSDSKEIRVFEIVSKVEDEKEDLSTYLQYSEFEEFVRAALKYPRVGVLPK